MICVSIGRGRHRHVIAEHRHLVERGAKLVELRLDYIQGSVQLKRLIADRPCPVIITCRRQRDGGKYIGSEEERLTLLRAAIAAGVDYVDLEDDIAGEIPRFGPTKRIISRHDFRQTPKDLEAVHAQMAALDADIVKLATMANRPGDNVRMLKLIEKSKVPTAGICMGDMGTPSRLLAGRFGAPITYCTFHHERALAPGQLSFEEMTEIYRYDQIHADTAIYGVIADPVGHSLSPQVHNTAFQRLDNNAVYIPFRVPQQDLGQFMKETSTLGIRGLSVTIPHKEAVAKFVTKIDPAVRSIGAVNTIVFDGKDAIAYNTDYKAAVDSLEAAFGEVGAKPSPLTGRTAMILGAGGAARAIVYGLRKKKADFYIASRTHKRAKRLAEQYGGRAVEWAARHGIAAEILINCSPIGMHPEVDQSPYDKHRLRPSMLVFDTVYNPENTLLVKDALSQSCEVITGVEMFVRQACLQFYLFTGQHAPHDLVRDVMKRALRAEKY